MTLLGLESLDESGEIQTPTVDSVRVYTAQIQQLVIARLNAAISCKLLTLVNVLHDSYTGCLSVSVFQTHFREWYSKARRGFLFELCCIKLRCRHCSN